MNCPVPASRIVASNGKVLFFQLLSEGRIIEMVIMRKIAGGMLIRKMEPHERWGYLVHHQGDFVTAVITEEET